MKKKAFTTEEIKSRRTKWVYIQIVAVPVPYRKLLWEYPSGKAPLEKMILRLLVY